MMKLIPTLTDYTVSLVIERLHRLISLHLHWSNTLTNHPSIVAPRVSATLTTTKIDEVHASVSDDDYNSPALH